MNIFQVQPFGKLCDFTQKKRVVSLVVLFWITATVAATTLLTITPEPGNLITGVADKETTTAQGEQQRSSMKRTVLHCVVKLNKIVKKSLYVLFIQYLGSMRRFGVAFSNKDYEQNLHYNVVMFKHLFKPVCLNYFEWCLFKYLFMLQRFNLPNGRHHPFELVDLHCTRHLVRHLLHLVYVEKVQ